MSQYDDVVERQRLIIQAEDWASKVKSIHAHSLSSMWYDDRPEDTADGRGVLDVEYNSGRIERTLDDDSKVFFGEELKGDALFDAFSKAYNG